LGYTRHRRLGEPACDICLESVRMYDALKRQKNADQIKIANRTQYAKNRDKRMAYQRAYYAKKRLERQSQTSNGSASPPSEMPSA
jgi:hypothetical protein